MRMHPQLERLVYIAGPYSAPSAWQRECNIRAAECQSLKLWRAGVPSICVHTMTRHFFGELDESDAIAIDDQLLLSCDAVLLCPGWRDSKGTLRELEIAKANGIRIFDVDQADECIAWARLDKIFNDTDGGTDDDR